MNNKDLSANSAGKQPDLQKRKTLKLGVTSVASVAGVTGLASAGTVLAASSDAATPSSAQTNPKHYSVGEFSVQVKHCPSANDISVVLTNRGTAPSVITAITPSQIHLARGSIDFSEILETGNLELKPGESVIAPFKPRSSHGPMPALALQDIGATGRQSTGDQSSYADSSLKGMLRSQLSIITEGDSFAASHADVTIDDSQIMG